jgi:NAD-dependent deacetylase
LTKSNKKIVVLSGAGISAESGIKTFRDADGLWEGYDVMEVASIQAWHKTPELLTEFYNQRRMQLARVHPNAGHQALAELERYFNVEIITQNVDDLHERAGSNNVLHLHGELRKMRSVNSDGETIDIGYTASIYGTRNTAGELLRPNIVWFGEEVPMIEKAIEIIEDADILIVVGTSLEVYPAAGLLHYFPNHNPLFLIDPNRHEDLSRLNLRLIKSTAAEALPKLAEMLIEKYV